MTSAFHQDVEAKIKDLGHQLPQAMAPAANYVPFKIAGDDLYVSGQLPADADGTLIKGICGADIDEVKGSEAATLCALNILAQAHAALGDFDKIAGLTKIVGFVASTPDFGKQPVVVNGASDLLVNVLGERGRHARSAVGMAALPFGVAVEVEAIFKLKA